ncbi:unnamed protein product [Orchesella dallaii]|uniref:Arrestin C-terminal-like domain-containing protein n=1 Tax=Orchesella dallaii TaxID=48710 RepID=A0ABP1PSY6_9HEXA
MPFPASVGALRGMSSRSASPVPTADEISAWEYEKTQKFLTNNLKCTIKIHHETIPSHFGKVTGSLAFEARKEIFHDGIFVLVKGISLSRRRRKDDKLSGKKTTPALKFKILSHSGREEADDEEEEELSSGAYFFEAGTETYPLELVVRKGKVGEDLPPPMITPDGKLCLRFQGYVSVAEKHFLVGEIKVHYQGYYNLIEHPVETEKVIRNEIQLNYKKGYLCKRKFADISLSCDGSGYLGGESIDFLVVSKNPEKIHLKYKVELLEKLWYQEPTRRQSGRMPQSKKLSVKMKEILIASEEKVGESGEKEMMWKGGLKIPENQTPYYKYDFLNSISYNLRLSVVVVGDEGNGKVSGESPIYIGTVRESEEDEEEEEDEDGDQGNADSEADSNADSNCSGIDTPFMMGLPSRSMSCIYHAAESSGWHGRRRRESIASTESSGSSTPSLFRMPPSYSQLSSRRPTLETLPPEYCELELQEQPSQENEDDPEENKEVP